MPESGMGLARQLGKRLERLERAAHGRPPADRFDIIRAVAAGSEEAEGRPPGLYRAGSPRSTAGVLVFDPSAGEPVVPEGRLAPWGLVIVCGPGVIEPPAVLPGDEAR
jgi:hypothetical protein